MAGSQLAFDDEHFSKETMGKLKLRSAYQLMNLIYNTLPLRLKGIYVINNLPEIEPIFTMTLPKNLKESVSFC